MCWVAHWGFCRFHDEDFFGLSTVSVLYTCITIQLGVFLQDVDIPSQMRCERVMWDGVTGEESLRGGRPFVGVVSPHLVFQGAERRRGPSLGQELVVSSSILATV